MTKIPYRKEKEIFKKIDEICPGIAIMTKGADGTVISDGNYLYQVRASEIKNMEVICHNLPLHSPVEGLLGLNFLKKVKVIIDLSDNIIEIP